MAFSIESHRAGSCVSRERRCDDLPSSKPRDRAGKGSLKRAIIVGSEGQDGRLLYDRLQSERWDVLGIGKGSVRSTAGEYAAVDILKRNEVESAVRNWRADAVFYLAAKHGSSEQLNNTSDDALFERSIAVNVQGLVNFLEAIPRTSSLFYAASSHVFGQPDSPTQDETTPFRPDSIYGITKTAGIHACHYYRNTRSVRASVGILYNHESPLRKPQFVTQKIVKAAVEISRGSVEKLVLGDVNAAVDWGYAPDYVDAMLRIALLPEADDFVIATGETHTVGQFAEIAFACVNLDWQKHVIVDDRTIRRSPYALAGNSARLRQRTGWAPTISFREMVQRLVNAECERASA